MSNRICIISFCDECPHFDNVYYGYDETCKKLNRKIVKNGDYRYDIPDDCPLTLEVAGVNSVSIILKHEYCALCGRMGCSGSCFK